MRKVLYKKWIPRVSNGLEGQYENKVAGTGCYEPDFIHEGMFHQWSVAYEESSEGFGNYTVALVENPDGTIEEIFSKNIKFVNEEAQSITPKALSLMEQTEKELIKKTLIEYNNHRMKTAKALGISTRTLFRKLKQYNINPQ